MKLPWPEYGSGDGGERGVGAVHERQRDRALRIVAQPDEPVGLEGDLEPEPTAIEVAALQQAVGHDDRVGVDETHRVSPPYRG